MMRLSYMCRVDMIMRLRCYELYLQPRAEMTYSSDMIIEMHSMALFMRFRWPWNALHNIYLKYFENVLCWERLRYICTYYFLGTIQVLRRGARLLRKDWFEKNCFCWPTPFCFSPLQVLDSLNSEFGTSRIFRPSDRFDICRTPMV